MRSQIDAYLATPYTHPDPAVQEWRFERVTEAVALLLGEGYDCIYSPITHSHPIDKHLPHRQADHDFWVNKFDLPFLANSARLLVLLLPGWSHSTGVSMEIKQAGERSIPVSFVEPVYDEMFRLVGVNIKP